MLLYAQVIRDTTYRPKEPGEHATKEEKEGYLRRAQAFMDAMGSCDGSKDSVEQELKRNKVERVTMKTEVATIDKMV